MAKKDDTWLWVVGGAVLVVGFLAFIGIGSGWYGKFIPSDIQRPFNTIRAGGAAPAPGAATPQAAYSYY